MTFDNMAKAIEAFEATLITPAARFDAFLEGNAKALDKTEQKALSLFVEKGDYFEFRVGSVRPALPRHAEAEGNGGE